MIKQAPLPRLLALCLAATSLLAGEAGAQRGFVQRPPLPGKHCLDEERTKLILGHSIAGIVNPLGLENRLSLSLCMPLIRRPGVLFSATHLEAGAVNYVSPTHIHGGGFVSVAPLSILVLRGEVTGLFIWPTALPGAGYLSPDAPPAGYPKLVEGTFDLPSGQAAGVRTLLEATLRAEVPLGARLRLAAVNTFGAEFWKVGDAVFFYNARRDVIMKAGGDFVLSNVAVLVLTIQLRQNYLMRLGAMDDLVHVPADPDGYLGNIVAGLIALTAERASDLARNLTIFVRAGAYTHHGWRTESMGSVTIAGGLSATYELIKSMRKGE